MPDSIQDIVSRVVEPDETILWLGAPDVDALCAQAAGEYGFLRGLFSQQRADFTNRAFVILVPLTVTALILWQVRDWAPVGQIMTGMAVLVVTLALIGGWGRRRGLRSYAESLAYAITDRRLLIIQDGVIADAYGPGDLAVARRRVLPRTAGYADVHFERITISDEHDRKRALWPTAPDPTAVRTGTDRTVRVEQANKAFKALPNAEAVDLRIRDWLEEHERRGAEALGDFAAEIESGTVSDHAHPGQRISNPKLGVELTIPEDWKVRVRTRPGPSRPWAVDMIDWKELGSYEDWNVLEAEGDLDAGFSLELVAAPAIVLTAKYLGGGLLFRLLGGRSLEVREGERIGAFEGFQVTRRTPSKEKRGPRRLQRYRVLHDGTRQLVLVTQWREDQRELERALEAIVASVRLD